MVTNQHLDAGITFLDTTAAATLLGLSRRTLEGYRLRGGGPTFRRHGGRVVYGLEDLIAWSEASKATSTADLGSRAPRT